MQLLVAMGYGGSYAEAAQVTRATGDGGIDGIIKEDRSRLREPNRQEDRFDRRDDAGRPDDRARRGWTIDRQYAIPKLDLDFFEE